MDLHEDPLDKSGVTFSQQVLSAGPQRNPVGDAACVVVAVTVTVAVVDSVKATLVKVVVATVVSTVEVVGVTVVDVVLVDSGAATVTVLAVTPRQEHALE